MKAHQSKCTAVRNMWGMLGVALLITTGLTIPFSPSFDQVKAAGEDAKQVAFKIGGKTTTLDEVYKSDQGAFYEIEKRKYELIERLAHEKFLESFWQGKAKESNKSVEAARKAYLEKNVKISDKEVKETLERFKDHPQLSKLPKEDQDRQVRQYLEERQQREVLDGIVQKAIDKGELVIGYPKPQEPVYEIAVKATDPVRYGPKPEDTKPLGCTGDACPITIVEYSEFQCPFCSKVMPSVDKVLTDYKGKVRWITRDFPLSFHDRARPAAVAAKCAADQGKYWEMYKALFAGQMALDDENLLKYGEKIGLDKKSFKKCIDTPAPKITLIEENFESGAKLGVSGTPAFFINGRRLSGALPFEEFKRVIDDELRKAKKS